MKTLIILILALSFIGCKKPLEPINTLTVMYKPTGHSSYLIIKSNEFNFTKNQQNSNNKVMYSNNVNSNFTIQFQSSNTEICKDSIKVVLNGNTIYNDYVMELDKEFSIK